MKAMYFIIFFLLAVTGVTVYNHYHVHGSFNVVYLVVVFFLVLNLLINYWELILWAKKDYISESSDHYYNEYPEDRSVAMSNFMNTKVTPAKFFSPSYWADVWVGYSMYDRSYADKRTFGFAIDVCNGLSTLLPSVLVHVAMTYHFLEANILGMIMLALFWQMGYGTLVYWFSFLVAGRHKLLSTGQNVLVIIGSNVPWFIFSCVGFYVAVRLILDNNYSVFGI